MYGLTPRQHNLLEYLKSIDSQIGPSYDEISQAMGYKSKSQAHRMVKALAERGYVTFIPGKRRSLKVIK